MKIVDVFEKDSGYGVALPLDAMLRVTLAESPGTGYRWQLEEGSGNCLALSDRNFFPPGGPAIGAAGLAVFSFKPLRPGYCLLALKLWRPWEGDQSVVRRFQTAVSIMMPLGGYPTKVPGN
ncbi:MAG: protease inhibitor I42 family protein [Negativicutes bacterium]|nr:protease inhibitor I42 family protein [Negativicutes bacterium]